jgi:hypothetical protein
MRNQSGKVFCFFGKVLNYSGPKKKLDVCGCNHRSLFKTLVIGCFISYPVLRTKKALRKRV